MVDINKVFSTSACIKWGETVLLVAVYLVECKNSQNLIIQNAAAKTGNIGSG
jgi:hypothetical protein